MHLAVPLVHDGNLGWSSHPYFGVWGYWGSINPKPQQKKPGGLRVPQNILKLLLTETTLSMMRFVFGAQGGLGKGFEKDALQDLGHDLEYGALTYESLCILNMRLTWNLGDCKEVPSLGSFRGLGEGVKLKFWS